ncbi:MAG: hypothetical protein A2020_09210 [Lentisphaerae bacterium GWF2_45_14]|nr:MAG: hypothetical protein A2020_09210 [Lentisphaerae bacterium GWF2_45_14]
MNFDFPIAFSAVKLIAIIARFGAFISAFPIFSSETISMRYKMFFVISISALLMPVIPADWMSSAMFKNLDLFNLSFMILSEVMLGFTIALFVLILVEILHFGGFIIDQNMGFMMGNVIDPVTNSGSTPFSHLLVQSFFIIFLIFDGHHEVIRLAAYSFQTIPPGGFIPGADLAETAISLSSRIFFVGIQIAFPIFASMFILSVAMGIIARIGEDFPVLELSFSIRFALGFTVLIGTIPVIMAISREINGEVLEWVGYLIKF